MGRNSSEGEASGIVCGFWGVLVLGVGLGGWVVWKGGATGKAAGSAAVKRTAGPHAETNYLGLGQIGGSRGGTAKGGGC